ncbi:MAG TPA: hypothetical protein VMT36_02795 [Candidatus Saccharimonadia bacterium]|nr:hypothetical protein [Candidatus Saccharimonadia bacterium]
MAHSDPFVEGLAPLPDVDEMPGGQPTWNPAPPPTSDGGGGGAGGGGRFMAMPQLMGAPAYARPPRLVAESPRPLDPDDLPIQALRSPEEEALLSGVYQEVEEAPTLTPSSQGGLRAVASRLFGSGS